MGNIPYLLSSFYYFIAVLVTWRFYCDHLVGLKRRLQYFKIYDFTYHKEKEKLPAVAILPQSINRMLI